MDFVVEVCHDLRLKHTLRTHNPDGCLNKTHYIEHN